MNVIVTFPFIDRDGRAWHRQIRVESAEITNTDNVWVDVRDEEHHAWVPVTLISDAEVEFRE